METPKHNSIFNADSLKKTKDFPDKVFDITFTSPPYNRKRNDKYSLYDDTIDDYFLFLKQFTDECIRLTKRHVMVNIQKNYYNKNDVFKYIGYYADKIQEILIWNKPNPMPRGGNSVINGYEFVIVIGNEPLKTNSTYVKNIVSLPVNSDNEYNTQHKAVMSLDFCNWVITNFTREHDFIFDPFFGTGTTGVSCLQNKRYYCGIELVENFYQLALQRLNQPIQKNLF